MRKKTILLLHKKNNSHITIYDDIINFKIGNWFVPIESSNGKFELMLLDNIIENYKFPINNNSLVLRYLNGYDKSIKFEYYEETN